MAFVQTNVNYAAEYSRAISNGYPYLSYFSELWLSEPSTTYKPGLGKTVYIPSLTVKGSTPVDRDNINGVFTRNVNNAWTAKELDMDREWSTLIDPMDIDESNTVLTIANVTKTFNEYQKIPEMDAYMASKLYSFTTPDTTALTAANIVTKWDEYTAAMRNARVPFARAHAYMSPAAYNLLKQSPAMTRMVVLNSGAQGISREVASLDGIGITVVPADMLMSAYTFTEGYAAATGAKQINLILVDPMAVAAPVKYDTAMVSAPTAQSKGKHLYYERYYYGAFALPNKAAGIIVNAAS